MYKVLKFSILLICIFMLAFMFFPTGSSATEVIDYHEQTYIFTSSGVLPYQYVEVIKAGDPLLKEIEAGVSGGSSSGGGTVGGGGNVNYVWVTGTNEPVTHRKTSSFPVRGGDTSVPDDNTGRGVVHLGTDLAPEQKVAEAWQVALWGGKIHTAGWNSSYGWMVLIDHGNHFYTRYAHMGYSENNSSLKVVKGAEVKAGDILGRMGNTGDSYGAHAHIELIIAPNNVNGGVKYYAGVDNILRGKKKLSELTWYKLSYYNKAAHLEGAVDFDKIPIEWDGEVK